MHNATSAPNLSFYDYIVVGDGTAGCPLAPTLSRKANVLLLERRGHPYGDPNITKLANFRASLSDLSQRSPSQRFISTDGVINARARVLGGGSCLNAGFYTRAAPRICQSAVRDGLIEVGVMPFNGFTFDHINGTKVGGTIFDEQGNRHTAADLLMYANPGALTVLLYVTVHRILFRSKGAQHKACLKRGSKNEIILSAGALGSSQLLMLSGIGPAAHLRSHNIRVVLDQPMVGQGMSDNHMNAVFVPSPLPVEVSLIQVVGITNFGSYIEAASGESFTTSSLASSSRFYGMFSPKIGRLSTVPPKQRTPEAIAEAIEYMNSLDQIALQGGFILEKIMDPISTGHLELQTRDPNDNPDTVMTIWHYHGGCQVGRVVDLDYRVFGVDAPRVIDGSTYNYTPGTNPQATVMMLGRYMGVKILSER
ncbi:hypothetical protein F3Y22_tig00110223pilonHSYRG00259 [Hibiscus syriacus]|uniref:Glucose-methanol-choline oxidoreductase N-terminal domain-containing protein n=1 Tax=Hibiscus syriacus TaxID=106335 RepID=A0A6A3BA52_HIBSY|nr:hypothetical protein F3Y22_tig00110223pilonHSYRG00259 [Hibiscus syriacus]